MSNQKHPSYSQGYSTNLLNSALTLLASEMAKRSPLEQSRILLNLSPSSARDAETLRQREKRSGSARIVIPEVVDIARRERCLADPERFLRTYFADKYRLAFGKDHLFMIDTIVNRARNGGRQAVAAPRGRGKSELTKGLLVYIVLAELVRFPLVVAATSDLAKRIYEDFRKKLATNQILLEDFPEVCYPIRALEGAPQRAGRQHVDGVLTGIVWTGDYINLPNVIGSPYGGVKMTYYGLDAAFRGANIDSDRPDFVVVDDPETRESAKSVTQIEDREAILDQDVSGLASQEKNLAIVVLSTVQNPYCLSARLTDPTIKSEYNGKRFGMVLKWPENEDLWQQYTEIRKQDQINGDEHGRNAVKYYLDNREKMDAGVEMLSDHFVPITLEDGTELVHSAIQQAYNRISATSLAAYRTEYQNDPPEEAGPQGSGVTSALIGSRISGLARRQLPADTVSLTAAIDLGKYLCHWVVIAWRPGAGGCVVDYGIEEVAGTDKSIDNEASEPMILRALLNWRDKLLQKEFVDATGTNRKVDFCFVDSGTFTNAAYEFCRQVRGIFHPSKGINPYHRKAKNTDNCIAGANLHAAKLASQNLWLYELDSSYWKQWVHERFLTPTFDEQNMLRRGAMSLFTLDGANDPQRISYCHHLASEEWVREFIEGKGTKERWHQKNENNHWFDATYYAAAASEVCGVRLLGSEVETGPREVTREELQKPKPRQVAERHGVTRPKRAGGWIPKRRW